MATLDWIVLFIFFVGLFVIVWWVLKHKKDNTSDYFLSVRSEHGWLLMPLFLPQTLMGTLGRFV